MIKIKQDFFHGLALVCICTIILTLCISVCGCRGDKPDHPDRPTPTPKPHEVVVTWDSQHKKLLFDGIAEHGRGIGDYFAGECVVQLYKHNQQWVEAYHTWLESYDINYVRTFVESTFQKARLEHIGIPTAQIFRKNAQGKYILTANDTELNQEWIGAMKWYADSFARHGIAWCLVLVDQCMHKNYGTDLYGWPTNQYNHLNNVFGYWDYTGGEFFKYYHFILKPEKFPFLQQVRVNVTRAIVNAMQNKTNVIWEVTNEGSPWPEHPDYPAFENLIIDHVKSFYPSEKVQNPIICDSSEGRYVSSRCNWTNSHGGKITTQDRGLSFDGSRCTAFGKAGFQAKVTSAFNQGFVVVEAHKAFVSLCVPNATPMDLGAYVWFDQFPAPIAQYEAHIGPWLKIMQDAPQAGLPPAMVINEFYDPANSDTRINGKEYPF